MFTFKKDYKENEQLRASFNALAKRTFGLDFEDWYQNGYWRENYIPYSMVYDGNVVANVSVNLTEMLMNGEIKRLIQLGTVMTDEAFRGQALIRGLMEEIEKDYAGKTDGMYLFANDSVLDFYPKFGYRKAAEYQYVKTVQNAGIRGADAQNTAGREESDKVQENVYYDAAHDAYVIAEQEGDTLTLHSVFAPNQIPLDDVIRAFGDAVLNVVLGFTPKDTSGFLVREVHEEDTTLFVKGGVFECFEEQKLMFPTLAHA